MVTRMQSPGLPPGITRQRGDLLDIHTSSIHPSFSTSMHAPKLALALLLLSPLSTAQSSYDFQVDSAASVFTWSGGNAFGSASVSPANFNLSGSLQAQMLGAAHPSVSRACSTATSRSCLRPSRATCPAVDSAEARASPS